jgi:nucleoside-diphosphate-sugar epimerase
VPRRLAVTGANGYVGRHLIAAARAAGWEVAGVVRSPAGAAEVVRAGGTPVLVPALDAAALARAFAGSDAVAHLAQIGAGDPDAYEAVNVEGTRQVADAAARAGVPRVAFFSGLGVAHYGMARRTTNRYFLSKLAAEAVLFGSGLAVDVFRPSYIVGPGDALVRALLLEMAEGVVERPGDGRYRMQPLAVADAADALLAAAGSPPGTDPPHRVYDLVGPEPIPYDAFVERLAARMRARGQPGRYTTLAVPVEEADRQARAGGYRGLQPDELDCMLCDEVADPAPLTGLLRRPLVSLDAALDAGLVDPPLASPK